MGIFAKVKQFLGFTGVKVKVEVDEKIPKDSGLVEGRILVTAAADQHVLGVTVQMYEQWSHGSGADRKTDKYDMGEWELGEEFDLKAGDERKIPFSMGFVRAKSKNDKMIDQGGVMGAMGKVGAFMDSESSMYFINASVDVQGAALDPNDVKIVQLV